MALIGVFCEDPSLDTKEPVPWADCLACARTWQNPCSFSYPLLAAIKTDSEVPHSFPSVSGITGCLRKSWLMHHVDRFEYPSSRVALLVGTAIHNVVEQGTALLPDVQEGAPFQQGDAIAEIPVQWTSSAGHVITGTADLYYRSIHPVTGADVGVLADWKSAKWIYLSKLPYGHHAAQVNIYAYLLERNELQPQLQVDLLQMMYIAKTGPDTRSQEHNGVVKMWVEKWPESKTRAFITAALNHIYTAEDTGTAPPGVLHDRSKKWECSYCPMRRECDQIEQGTWTLG